MIKVKRIGLAGVGPFKKEVFLDIQPGVTYLYGKDATNGGNGNAAGKSLFASSPADIFYDVPMVGNKQDKPRKGVRTFEFETSKGHDVKVVTSFKGRTEQIALEINGNDRTKRTSKLTRETLAKVWTLSEDDYRTYAFLDSQVPHPLVRGSTLERKAFFTSFFRLDVLDAERKLFNAELLKVKKAKAGLAEVEKAYADVSKSLLSREEVGKLATQMAFLNAKISKLRDQSDAAQRIRSLVEFEAYAGEHIKKLAKLCPNHEEFSSVYGEIEDQIQKIEAAQEQMLEYVFYRKAIAEWREATADLDMETPLEELAASAKAYAKALSKLEDFDEKPIVPEVESKPDTDKDELTAKAAQYRHALQHARKFKTGVCGECGQEVKAEDPEIIKKRLAKVDKALEAWESYESSVIRNKEAQESYEIWSAARKDAKAHKANAETYEKRRGLKKPAKVEKPEVVGDAKALRADLATLDFCQSHLDTITNLKKLTAEERAMKFDNSALNELSDRQAELKVKLEVHRSVKERAAELKARMTELQELTANEKALELLVAGYAEKAVKKMAIEAISQRLMAQVNKYAPLVFQDYHFDFVWDSQISIRVHRPGTDEPTDVRKLSGAESKLFTLIFVLSQLMFVPKNKRLSLLVLDEPMASFSEETSELFQKLLPHILQLIPSILVVTPDARERLEGANEYTVLRTIKGSRIVKGHPNEL